MGRNIKKDFDTINTQFPICPYCGHEHTDIIDFNKSGDYNCSVCGKLFSCNNEIEISFTTRKK